MSPPRNSNGLGSWLFFIATLLGAIFPIYYVLEKNLEKFYIFDHEHLHDLSQRAIAEHGNDTKAIVDYIVTELHGMHPANVNLNEEWMFNNAGGAMGAMYIIHASKCSLGPFTPTSPLFLTFFSLWAHNWKVQALILANYFLP